MNFYSLPALITTITTALLGGFVYLKGRRLTVNRMWAVFSIFVATWSFSVAMIMNAPNERIAIWLARMIYFAAIPIPAVFLHFVLAYVGEIHNKRLVLLVAYLVSGFFIIINCTDLIIKDIITQQAAKF